MSRDQNGDMWCDYCGREITSRHVEEKGWTFHNVLCKDAKLRLIYKAEQKYGEVVPIRSIYKAFQEEGE